MSAKLRSGPQNVQIAMWSTSHSTPHGSPHTLSNSKPFFEFGDSVQMVTFALGLALEPLGMRD